MATTQTKDYYGTLGVKKGARRGRDQARRFAKLARKYHPDVNPGDKKAEEKFKEISEANDVLSDDKKRKIYDQFGFYSDNIDRSGRGGGGCAGRLWTGTWGGAVCGWTRAGARRRNAGGSVRLSADSISLIFRKAARGSGAASQEESGGFGGSFKDIFSGACSMAAARGGPRRRDRSRGRIWSTRLPWTSGPRCAVE